MMERLFWLFTAAVLGVAIHLATILYFPGLTFQHNLRNLTAGAIENQFFLMKPETQGALLPTASPQDVVGLCLVDVKDGRVTLSSHMPRGQWMLTVYGASGEQVYSINDVEAGSGDFTIELAPAKGLIEQLRGKAEKEVAGQFENVGWHAELNEERGIAVLWVPVVDALRRPAIEAAVSATHCERK